MIDFYCMMGILLRKARASFQLVNIFFLFLLVIRRLLMEIDKLRSFSLSHKYVKKFIH